MIDEHNKTQKIRFKFANGEEFEAEGNPEFIESQRDYFLALVNKRKPNTLTPREDASVSGTLAPRLYATAPGTYTHTPTPTQAPEPPFSNSRLWEQLLKQEGDKVVLRRKFRLSPHEASMLILGGAKILLNKTAYSALALSQAVELSGFQISRLDRQLAPAVKLGYIVSEGSKRSRTYALTPAGFAHAFMLAQKKAADTTLP